MDTLRVPFPTYTGPPGKGSHNAVGFPDQAKPCAGHRCLIHDGECMWCGRLPAEQIARTWARRAIVVDRAARAPAPFGRFVYVLGGAVSPGSGRVAA